MLIHWTAFVVIPTIVLEHMKQSAVALQSLTAFAVDLLFVYLESKFWVRRDIEAFGEGFTYCS